MSCQKLVSCSALADGVGKKAASLVPVAEKVQDEPPNRIGRITAVRKEVLERLVTGRGHVQSKRRKEVSEQLRRKVKRPNRFRQVQ